MAATDRLAVALVPAALLLSATPAAAQRSSGAPSAEIVNLAHHVLDHHVGKSFVVFSVPEYQSGESDWNDDGDQLDLVLFHADLESGAVVNSRLATGPIHLDGPWVLFQVSEAAQGELDLNGDGDAGDAVLHALDARTGTITNLGLHATAVHVRGELASFAVTEARQGDTDLNGDGDTLDSILHTVDLGTMTTRSFGLALHVSAAPVADGHVAAPVWEFSQGWTDLNGDGDANDVVLHVISPSGSVQNLGRAILSAVQVAPGTILYAVSESGEGADWNADGDQGDFVVHQYDVGSAKEHNLAAAVLSVEFGTDGTRLWVLVSENSQGATDLNGDGDAIDRVLHVAAVNQGSLTNVGLESNAPTLAGTHFVFRVREALQGEDLNGDGDLSDFVAHARHGVHGATSNLGLALPGSGEQYLALEDFVALHVSEAAQGADLNGDGDTFDRILHSHRLPTGVTTNLRIAAEDGLARSRGFLAFLRSEAQTGSDFNGDGDADDNVPHVVDLAGHGMANLALAVMGDGIRPPQRLNRKHLAFRVRESKQGNTDLNGDGDVDDDVLHFARLAPSRYRTATALPMPRSR